MSPREPERRIVRIGLVPRFDDRAADEQRQAAAGEQARRVEPQRRAANSPRKQVGDQRVGAGCRGCFANADADPRDRECRDVARETAERRHQRPQAKAQRQQPGPVPAVGEPAERDAEQRVEDRECRAVEKPQLGIVEPEIRLDVVGEDRKDLPVDEIEQIHEKQDTERIPAVRRHRLPRLGECLGFVHDPHPLEAGYA